MRHRSLNPVVVGAVATMIAVVASADDAKNESIQKDRNRIEGTWRVAELVVNGNRAMEDDARRLAVVNGSDGTWSLRSEGREISKGTSCFDPTKMPKTIDFTPTEGEARGNQYLGIYELGEDTRRMCFDTSGKQRPSDFSSSPGSDRICLTFERERTK